MITVIINRYSKKTIDYKKALSGIDKNFLFVTREKHANDFKDDFKNMLVYEEFDGNMQIEADLIAIHDSIGIESIVVSHEFDIDRFALLREKLNILGQSLESAREYRDKFIMKSKLKEKVALPRFSKVNNITEINRFASINGYPFVCKPINSAGSMGFMLIESHDDLKKMSGMHIDYPLLVEEYIVGDMCHADGIFYNGEIKVFSCSKYLSGCTAFLENKYTGSSMIDQDNKLFQKIKEEVNTVLNTLESPSYPFAFHGEFFIKKDSKLIFCEIASRVGGAKINDTVYMKTGINLLEESIRAQCDKSYDINRLLKKYDSGKSYGFMLFPPRKGKLLFINREVPFEWIVQFNVRENKIGSVLSGGKNSVSEIFDVIIEGENSNEISKRVDVFEKWASKNVVWKIK